MRNMIKWIIELFHVGVDVGKKFVVYVRNLKVMKLYIVSLRGTTKIKYEYIMVGMVLLYRKPMIY